MLRLSLGKEAEAFRLELRGWLKENPPPQVEHDSSLESFQRIGREWQARLAEGKWIAVHWPQEVGGRGLSLVEEAIVQEELVRAHSPQVLGLFGLTMVGPVLIEHGTKEQQQRFLPSILDASEVWCQGFSEPGAGSDLAAMKTKAVRCEGGFRISGQKVWTSFAHVADWCFALCRTDSEGKKHEGLTYFLIDMKEKGITTRPLKQITGDDEFNEVFFDNVFVPEANIIGQVHEGWKIAISTLMFERVILTFARQLQSEVALRSLLQMRSSRPELKYELADHIATACSVRALAYSETTLARRAFSSAPRALSRPTSCDLDSDRADTFA